MPHTYPSKMFSALIFAFAAYLLVSACGPMAYADDVYSWKDESGRTHFSTKKPHAGAQAAELPEIPKEDLTKKIERIKAETPDNCEKHGGIDCSQGSDADGSVICLDGYRDAILPFRFSCMEARLDLDPKYHFKDDEFPVSRSEAFSEEYRGKQLKSLVLSARNLSSIDAYGVNVKLNLPIGFRSKEIALEGPDSLGPYGSADYTLAVDNSWSLAELRALKNARFRLRCTNCRGPVSK